MRRLGYIVATAALLAACAPPAGDDDANGAQLRPLERAIVGAGDPYPADPTLRDRLELLRSSKLARRVAAWDVVQRALAPVELRAKSGDGASLRLPRWRTWYQRDDISRLYGKLWIGLGADGRKARTPFSDEEIANALLANATDLGSFGDAQYAARIGQLTDDEIVAGVGGNTRVTYSPGFVAHALRHYRDVGTSMGRTVDAALDADFAPLLGAEFPIDAVIAKAAWSRIDSGMSLATHSTSADTLASRRDGSSDGGGWGTGEGTARPSADDIYTVQTAEGARYALTGLHIVSKELRDWMWITLWWSPDADSDFGADRPTFIDGPWAHYKMTVVVAYDEGDADPRGGAPSSLGDALAAVHEPDGGPSWASNPYLERGAHNAQTNCIGCHQHAGVAGLTSEKILADGTSYPRAARTQLRRNFPFDYVFAFQSQPESLVDLFAAQLQ